MPNDYAPPQVSPEGVSYLTEVSRSRAPGYIPDGSLAVSPAPQGAAVDGSADAENYGKVIRKLLGTAIPDGGAFNYQFLYGLKVIAKSMASKADDETMLKVIDDIYENRPKFPEFPFGEDKSARIVAKLYRKLNDYKNISGGDPNKLPYFEVLGQRRDDVIFKENKDHFPGIMDLGPEAREINEILDLIAPHSAHYNRLRREIIKEVLAKGEDVADWADSGWYSKKKDDAMESLKNKIEPWKKERLQLQKQLKRQLGQREQSNWVVPRLSVETVRSIRDVIRQAEAADRPEKPAAKRQRGDDGLPVGGWPRLVPEHLVAAVCPPAPGRTGINEIARTTANWFTDVMDVVIPPTERRNFARRVRWIEKLSYPDSLAALTSGKSRDMKSKDAELQELERLAGAFHQAWQGNLRELPPPPQIGAKEEKAVPKIKWRKPRGYDARVKAGNAWDQQKLRSFWQGRPSDADGGLPPPKAWVRIEQGRYLSLEKYREWLKDPGRARELPKEPEKLQVLVRTEYGDGYVEPSKLKSMVRLEIYNKMMENIGLSPKLSDVAHIPAPPMLVRHDEDWLIDGSWLGTDLDLVPGHDKFARTAPPGGKFVGFMPLPIFEERERERNAEKEALLDRGGRSSASHAEPGVDDRAAASPIGRDLKRRERSQERERSGSR